MSRRGISNSLAGIAAVVVLVAAVGGYLVLTPRSAATGSSQTDSSSLTSSTSSETVQPVVCTSGPSANANAQVSIADYSFTHSKVNITVGQSVQWTNNGEATHTVTSDSGLFGSGGLTHGSVFTCTFNRAGTYDYHCSIHPSLMMGVVKVDS
jgi:plastocyanin